MYTAIIKQSNVPKNENGGHSTYKGILPNERSETKNVTETDAKKLIKKAKREQYFENYPKGFYSTVYFL